MLSRIFHSVLHFSNATLEFKKLLNNIRIQKLNLNCKSNLITNGWKNHQQRLKFQLKKVLLTGAIPIHTNTSNLRILVNQKGYYKLYLGS